MVGGGGWVVHRHPTLVPQSQAAGRPTSLIKMPIFPEKFLVCFTQNPFHSSIYIPASLHFAGHNVQCGGMQFTVNLLIGSASHSKHNNQCVVSLWTSSFLFTFCNNTKMWPTCCDEPNISNFITAPFVSAWSPPTFLVQFKNKQQKKPKRKLIVGGCVNLRPSWRITCL